MLSCTDGKLQPAGRIVRTIACKFARPPHPVLFLFVCHDSQPIHPAAVWSYFSSRSTPLKPSPLRPTPPPPPQGDLSYLFVVSTSEKQWGASQATLRKVLGSFKV